MFSANSLVLGVDVGGTKVAAGLVDARGQIVHKARRPMVANRDAEDALAVVLRAADAALALPAAREANIEAAGISAPGYIDSESGAVIGATNLPCWRGFPLARRVAEHTGLATRIDNDGNAAALAEAVWGSGAGYRSVFYVTIGTGIGTGMVFDGRIHHGRTGGAGEGGHVSIDYRGPRCLCGKRGCIEMYAAGPAIAARAQGALAAAGRRRSAPSKREASLLRELACGKLKAVTAEVVGKAALEGDALANAVLREVADHLAVWLGNIVDLLEPDVIVVGGGLGHLMASFFGHMRERMSRWSINPRSSEIPIVGAMYGAESGIAGAAALWQEAQGRGAGV
ncbi:MAG TPA: ROK family protein [Terriglobales bacterium]|nr:ROK family protein [Terriglobales bacterium]